MTLPEYNTSPLSDKMRAVNDEELTRLADEFDAATTALYAPSPSSQSEEEIKLLTRKMLGAWARARKAWCVYSGEPLI